MSDLGIMYLRPHAEKKVWGRDGIGEYWYGAEVGRSSIAETSAGDIALAELLETRALEMLGTGVLEKFGCRIPLVKILTPRSRLSVQFHDKKDELWVVTGIDRAITGERAEIILGFSEKALDEYGKDTPGMYGKALEKFGAALNGLIDLMEARSLRQRLLDNGRILVVAAEVAGEDAELDRAAKQANEALKEVEFFYGYREVSKGDVIPVAQGTLHALGGGIEVVEPQIPGDTQSTEDGDTYPVRYAFPGFERPGAEKTLDIDRVNELNAERARPGEIRIVRRSSDEARIERLPGGFEKKGLAVERVVLDKGASCSFEGNGSVHILTAVKGKACLQVGKERYELPPASPRGRMLLIPASVEEYHIHAEERSQVLDTFVPEAGD